MPGHVGIGQVLVLHEKAKELGGRVLLNLRKGIAYASTVHDKVQGCRDREAPSQRHFTGRRNKSTDFLQISLCNLLQILHAVASPKDSILRHVGHQHVGEKGVVAEEGRLEEAGRMNNGRVAGTGVQELEGVDTVVSDHVLQKLVNRITTKAAGNSSAMLQVTKTLCWVILILDYTFNPLQVIFGKITASTS